MLIHPYHFVGWRVVFSRLLVGIGWKTKDRIPAIG